MKRFIIKSTGKEELFNTEKFARSLRKAGAKQELIDDLLKQIEQRPELKTTKAIYRYAFQQLKKVSPSLAAKYNLKYALMQLGPTGFPFENYIAQLFHQQGYTTRLDVIVQGQCISHEVDVVATKDNETIMIESKFHNRYGLKSDVKITLYVKARFDDIRTKFTQQEPNKKLSLLLITNTQFTTEAIMYAQCANLSMLGWGYPRDNGLEFRIEQAAMIPITALTSLNQQQKRNLIAQGCVLCRDVPSHQSTLKTIGIPDNQIQKIVNEAKGVCAL